MRKMIQRARNEKGFTLVELMVVVVIIGILVAIAVPIFNNVQANAKNKACEANERIISGAAAMYAAENDGVFPSDVSDLVGAPNNFLQEEPDCPWEGTYSIDPDTGIATCDGVGHPAEATEPPAGGEGGE